jgi:LytS/YehU family sensor histidine kinase
MMLTSMFYFLRRKMSLQEMGVKLREVEKQQVMSELKALKSQINPHFFFNTLNSIYSLSLENSPKTPDVVLKLSGLMRYVLYESSADKVHLKKELEFLKNYIDLEKSRFEDSVNVHFEADEQQLANFSIAPLLFIPFIENAFKHCNKTGITVPDVIIAFDTAKLPTLVFKVDNTKEESDRGNIIVGGVGLENVRQRLNLLYPDKHSLSILDEGDRYRIHLEVDLSLTRL